MLSTIVRFNARMQERRNFVAFVTACGGSIWALSHLWLLGGHGGLGWGLLLIVTAYFGAFIGALVMWPIFGVLFPRDQR